MRYHHEGLRGHSSVAGVPPDELVLKDLALLRSRDLLRTTREVEEIVLMQSLEGRAQMGHGQFAGRRYGNTTEDDLARSLNLDARAVRQNRQAMITEVAEWAQRAIAGETEGLLLTPEMAPLLRIGTFAMLQVDPEQVLRGLYLGGLRDTLEIRSATEDRYGLTLGCGRLYPVDMAVMEKMGLTGESLAHGDHESKIQDYRTAGLIVDAPASSDSSVKLQYIRHRPGPGASDDAAIVCGGLRFGPDVAIGVFLADAVDTLEKYVPAGQEHDQDAAIARQIEASWKDLRVGIEEACELTFLAAGGDGIPDSSLRHLLRVDRLVDQCPLESHLLKAAGRPYAFLELGHEKVPNDEFYAMLEGRIERMKSSPLPHSTTRH